MTTRISIGVGVLLLVSSVALGATGPLPGSLWQLQNFTVGNAANPGMISVVQLTHGDVSAWAKQEVEVDNENAIPPASQGGWNFSTPWGWAGGCSPDDCDTTGKQVQEGLIRQFGTATGTCGVVNVTSFLGANGTQEQVIGASTSGAMQQQALGVGATQALVRQDGAASGYSENAADLAQSQTGHNAAGTYGESSILNVLQKASVNGKALSNASVVTDLVAGTTQQQIVY